MFNLQQAKKTLYKSISGKSQVKNKTFNKIMTRELSGKTLSLTYVGCICHIHDPYLVFKKLCCVYKNFVQNHKNYKEMLLLTTVKTI